MSKQLTDQIVVRLDPALRARVEEAAASERRPIANFVRNVLADKFAGAERKQEVAGVA